MVSICITACVPEEALESWEFMLFTTGRICARKGPVGWVGGWVPCCKDFPHHLLLVRDMAPTRGNCLSTCLAAFRVFPNQASSWVPFCRKSALELHSSPWVAYSEYAWRLLFGSLLLPEEQNTLLL